MKAEAAVDSGGLAREIILRLQSHGHRALLVGGSVRDLLLNRVPKDYDVATDATPPRILELFPGSGQVGAHFGVVLVRRNGEQVEVATFRSDHAYLDGRRPVSVALESDPRPDALRRDFTINALMLDPVSEELFDFTGGRQDLDLRLIRAIGDPERRFGEDHLRLLRAVRFAAGLGFEIEPATFAAMRRLHGTIRNVSAERVRDELNRILTEGGARRGFELMDAAGLLAEVLPEVAAMKGVAQPPEFHPEGDVWTHTLLMLEGLERPSVTLAWGVLLHDVGKPPTFRVADRIRFDGHVEAGEELATDILTRLRFPGEQIRQILALVANHMRFTDVTRMRESTLRRFLRLEKFEEHLDLHRLDCLSSHRNLDNYEFAKRRIEETPPEAIRPPRILTGEDLIRAGYPPGPAFSRMLAAVEDAQLESRVSTPGQALELVRSLFGDPETDAEQ
jgi:tRNA nucleotidyltransferase/poly(A) polymerase